MATDVETETTIARPRAEVAAFAGEPINATAWYASIESAGWETPRPLAVGSSFAFGARFLGRRLSYVYEVKEYVEGERLVMVTTGGLLVPIMAPAVRRTNRNDLATLERVLEAAPA